MLRSTRLIAVLLLCTALLASPSSSFLNASAAPLAASAPPLHAAWTFAVLGNSTVTNTGNSVVTGDLGLSPGTDVTGFPPGTLNGTLHVADTLAGTAQADATTAYNDLAGQPVTTDLTGQDLGGLTLMPGVYHFDTSAQLTGKLTLDAATDPNAVWVFQIGSTLTTASNSSVIVTNQGKSCNVWWQVGSSATLGTDTSFAGYILADASIALNTRTILLGAALARNGAVTMDNNQVNNIDKCLGPNAIAMREFKASSAGGVPIVLGSGAALLLALGLVVVRRRVGATAGDLPSTRQGDGK